MRIVFIAGLFFLSLSLSAQISTPDKTNLNVGLYGGLSVVNYKPMVALDLTYKGTTLRLMPNYHFIGVGLTQELLRLSDVFYNIYWTASMYGGYRGDPVEFAAKPSNNYYKSTYTGVVNTGIKTYFSKRMYSHIMGGIMYSQSAGGNGVEIHDPEILPYFEFGLGVNIFKNYPKLKPEETLE
jgi:hypothetical protein